MKCVQCGSEFEPKRADAKYCSAKCRVTFSRNVTDNTNPVTDKEDSVTDNPEVVTDNVTDKSNFPETDKFISGSTRYVRRENSVVDILPKDDLPTKVICECVWCGERFGANAAGKCALYCKYCKTAEQRKQIKIENEQIRKENASRNKI